MARLTVADASVLIAWLDDTDDHHGDAIELLAEVDGFVIHPLTLAEVLVHPARRGREEEVLARLDAIGMIVSDAPNESLALARLRASTRLKMPDCVVLACAAAHDLPLATFDDGLRAAAAARLGGG